MKKNILSYLIGLSLICLGSQLLVSCDSWELPSRKTQRNCVKPSGTLNATMNQKKVDFTIDNTAGTIDQVSWDFGNGSTTTTTGMTVAYTYPTSGTYTVRATLSNACGTETTLLRTISPSDAVPPTVSLQAITTVTLNAATATMAVSSNGNATITRYGICYSPTNQTPKPETDLNQTLTGAPAINTPISFELKDLLPNTTYYAISYAVNSAGTGSSSPVQTFKTGQSPAVTTSGSTNIAITTATVNFVVSSPGNPAAVAYGICYSSTVNTPDINNSTVVTVSSPTVGANTAVNLTNLSASTTYYYRAYAKSPSGDVTYGPVVSFTTQVDAVTQDLIASVSFTNRSTQDASGNNNHAIVVDNPTFTNDRKGNANSAIQLDGVNDYFYMADNNTLRPDALSISVWIKPAAINNNSNRIQIYNKSRWNDSSAEMYSSLIKLNENGPGLTFMTNIKQNSNCQVAVGWQNFEFSSNFQLNTWHHLVFTYSGRSVRMYFDNVLVDQRDNLPANAIDSCPGGELKFGAQLRDYPNYFNGAMDDIRIYRRAISTDEVRTLFNQ